MNTNGLTDIRVARKVPLPSPNQIELDIPLDSESAERIRTARQTVSKILSGKDNRILLIVGPCSFHDYEETMEWCSKIAILRQEVRDRIELIARINFEKPRTRDGWRGFGSDPHMDKSFDVEYGVRIARKALIQIIRMDLPVATEYLTMQLQQLIGSLYSVYWLGARSVEDHQLRQQLSVLGTAVGVKNPEHGGLEPALATMECGGKYNAFIGPDGSGGQSVFYSYDRGNPESFLILRGNSAGPNCHLEYVQSAMRDLASRGLNERIMIDVAHGNCKESDPASTSGVMKKNHLLQQRTILKVANGIVTGEFPRVLGLMYESYLTDGNQPLVVVRDKRPKLKPGLSVTDPCDGLVRTVETIRELFRILGNAPKVKSLDEILDPGKAPVFHIR